MIDRTISEAIRAGAARMHNGACPICGGPGPVDVYRTHFIWSVIHFTRYGHIDHVCCRQCGKKKQWLAAAKCLLLGWWSLHGIFLTPFKLANNLAELWLAPDPARPSEKLLALVERQAEKPIAPTIKPETKRSLPLSPTTVAEPLIRNPAQPFETSTHNS